MDEDDDDMALEALVVALSVESALVTTLNGSMSFESTILTNGFGCDGLLYAKGLGDFGDWGIISADKPLVFDCAGVSEVVALIAAVLVVLNDDDDDDEPNDRKELPVPLTFLNGFAFA